MIAKIIFFIDSGNVFHNKFRRKKLFINIKRIAEAKSVVERNIEQSVGKTFRKDDVWHYYSKAVKIELVGIIYRNGVCKIGTIKNDRLFAKVTGRDFFHFCQRIVFVADYCHRSFGNKLLFIIYCNIRKKRFLGYDCIVFFVFEFGIKLIKVVGFYVQL